MKSTEKLMPGTSNSESVENEISRLSWAVVDGRATAEQRERLAELVSAQHSRRHPPTSGNSIH